MAFYLNSNNSNEVVAEGLPIAMTDSAEFSARTTRRELLERRAAEFYMAAEAGIVIDREQQNWNLTKSNTEPHCYRPFDVRWLYWEPHAGLLDRPREEHWEAHVSRGIAIASAQSNRRADDPPCVVSSMASLHLIERTAIMFPLQVEVETLPGNIETKDNISPAAEDLYPSNLSQNLFFHALATMHARRYRQENAGALLNDWPRIPLPSNPDLLAESAQLGRRLAELLDAESSINLAANWSFLAALKLPLDPNLDQALKITAGWGHQGQGSTVMPGRGLSPERPWTEPEREKLGALASTQTLALDDAITLLGATCVDVHLNGSAFWSAVPVNVWNYTLGGYLSYHEFTTEATSPLLHRALRPEEAAYFAQVVRRIAAILLLGPALDASYRAILPTATGLPAVPRL